MKMSEAKKDVLADRWYGNAEKHSTYTRKSAELQNPEGHPMRDMAVHIGELKNRVRELEAEGTSALSKRVTGPTADHYRFCAALLLFGEIKVGGAVDAWVKTGKSEDWSVAADRIAIGLESAHAGGYADCQRDAVVWASSGAAPAFAEQIMVHVERGEHVGAGAKQ